MTVLFKANIDTSRGIITVTFSIDAICSLYLPGFGPDQNYPCHQLPWPELPLDLNRYLEGKKVDWSNYPLDYSGYRAFTAAVLDVVSRIPYGQVSSYRSVARCVGAPQAWRATGQACGANRHPIIVPCHRVVGSDGKIGGFSGPSGWKEMLLGIERSAG